MKVLFRSNPQRPVPALPPQRAQQSTLIIEELVQRPNGISNEGWHRSRSWSADD